MVRVVWARLDIGGRRRNDLGRGGTMARALAAEANGLRNLVPKRNLAAASG